MSDEKKTLDEFSLVALELEVERRRKAAAAAIAARRARELRNIREAEEIEEAIERWRESKYQD